MKRIIIILLFIVTFTGFGQQEPCKPDCFNDNWFPNYPSAPLSITLPYADCNGLPVIIKYRYRYACPGQVTPCPNQPNGYWQDLYIESVEWLSTQVEICILNEGMSSFLNRVTKDLIKFFLENSAGVFGPLPCTPANCPPPYHLHSPANSCCDVWRVMKGACWKVDSQKRLLEPCIYTNCCLERYRVCIGDDVTELEIYPPEIIDTGICIDPPLSCYPVCTSVYR